MTDQAPSQLECLLQTYDMALSDACVMYRIMSDKAKRDDHDGEAAKAAQQMHHYIQFLEGRIAHFRSLGQERP